MGHAFDDEELRRRAVDGVRAEVEAFGSGAPDSRLLRRDSLIAAVVPSTPQRSIFNSVFCPDSAVLGRRYDELAGAYEAAGVRAWTVWVADEDRAGARALADRGHVLDGAPRAMAVELGALGDPPPAPAEVEPGPIEPAIAADLNDRAYGYGEDAFRAALAGETAIGWHGAYRGSEPVGCVGTIEIGDDCCVTGVATPPEWQRRGIAGWLLWRALDEARERGMATASLQASKAGAPAYERLGFRDFGFVELWEWRR